VEDWGHTVAEVFAAPRLDRPCCRGSATPYFQGRASDALNLASCNLDYIEGNPRRLAPEANVSPA